LDRGQRRMIYDRCGQVADCRKLHKSKRKLWKVELQDSDRRREDRMSVTDYLVAAKAAIGFRGVLHRLEVISNRDHREQNQDEHGKGDQLHAPVGTNVT
jgi:hypothetical protein